MPSRHHSSRGTRSSPPRGQSHSTSPVVPRGRGANSSPGHSNAHSRSPSVDAREAELNDLRRQLHALTNAKKPDEDGKKRKRAAKNSESTFLQMGRAIPRRVTVFDDLNNIQVQWDAYRAKYEDDSSLDELAPEPSDEEQAEKRELERGHTAVEEMEHVVKDFVKKAGKEGGRAMLSELEKGAESAKTHDTQSATRIVGRELNRRVRKMNEQRMKDFEEASRRVQEGSTTALTPLALIPEFDESSRTGRGLQNDMTGSLLCPGEIDWNDTNIRAAVKRMDPDYDFASSAHSRCFYKDEKFNPDLPDEGYLQSYLLLQVYRTIYTSPSSANEQSEDVENLPPANKKQASNSRRAHVANIIHLSEVTGRSIAYAAVHLHLALTDASRWVHSYDGYNYHDLWNFIVDFFEDPIDDEAAKQAKELLKWWTDRIFTGTGSASNSRGTKMVSRRQAVVKTLESQS
ncbi:hypothetical protein F5880DRAFT_1733206 [Lentinula raphanica]|nr:hypothetical protein F5880DRAFT_1733206 [Lentinula raphanica]